MNDRLAMIAICLMMLISSASAVGNGNQVYVEIRQEAEGNTITGDVFIAQVMDAVAFVDGNDNYVEQIAGLYANDNDLVGTDDMPSSITQVGVLAANATGNGNQVEQELMLEAYRNCLTMAGLAQEATQKAEVAGNNNKISQSTFAGSYNNALTISDLAQFSVVKASCLVGNDNNVEQIVYQNSADNCLTGSQIWQQAYGDASTLGNENSVYQEIDQAANEDALADSMMKQMVEVLSSISGNENDVSQAPMMEANENCLATNATHVQYIGESTSISGNGNYAAHDISLNGNENALTGVIFSQKSTVVTNL
jgi:hypothetical protein